MNSIGRLLLLASAVSVLGCNNGDTGTNNAAGGANGGGAAFTLAWSEYPSWSVFGVADEAGLINKDEGAQGPIEEKWGVDIVLQEADYDTCLTLYGSSTVDAVCMTNMDSLAPALGRNSVAILPTSTSDGADACIVVGIESIDELAGKDSHGLEKSVSQYMFERNLELAGKNPQDYPFKNMDPAAAAQAMQTSQDNIASIVVWNPFLLQTLRTRAGSKVVFDSTSIPEEIIDMVVMGKDALAKPGGEDFACAVIDTFYEMNKLLADPDKGDETLVALGAKFSSLPLDDMKVVVEQTRFYKTPDAAIELFTKDSFQNDTMPRVVDFCATHDIVASKPTVGYGDTSVQLNFDTSYIEKVKAK